MKDKLKQDLQDLLKRLSNVGTIVGITSAVIFILQSAGVLFDAERVSSIVQGLCTIGVLLGILNNSETKGMYIPLLKRYEDAKKEAEDGAKKEAEDGAKKEEGEK